MWLKINKEVWLVIEHVICEFMTHFGLVSGAAHLSCQTVIELQRILWFKLYLYFIYNGEAWIYN